MVGDSSRSIARRAVVNATPNLAASLSTVQNGFSAKSLIALSERREGAPAGCPRHWANKS